MDMTVVSMLGYEICREPSKRLSEAMADHLRDWRSGDVPSKWLACMNPHSYVQARSSPDASAALRSADWLLPDGAGIVLASRMFDAEIRERVTGADIFFGVQDELSRRGGGRVFFLGSTEMTLAKILSKMAEDYPNIEVVGTYSPPYLPEFSPVETAKMVTCINAAKPDILWVGMTAPKQEMWISDNLTQLDVGVAGGIGAVFDFYVGNIRRSPEVFQRYHLEWLPRLLQEPRRLWRRTLVSMPIFLWDVCRQRLGFGGY